MGRQVSYSISAGKSTYIYKTNNYASTLDSQSITSNHDAGF